jgi:hypothetical protein
MVATGIFMAVGSSVTGGTASIGSSNDNGQTWTLATTTNGLFGTGDGSVNPGIGKGIAYGQGLLVAVGTSVLGDNIGYSSDGGQTWTVAINTNGLFGGGGGYGVTYNNNTGEFVAVGNSLAGGNANIGYSTDGDNWTLTRI